MADESIVNAVFAYFGAHDVEPGFKALLLGRTAPTPEEWEEILPSDPEGDVSYAQGVHDGLRRFLVDPDGFIKRNIKTSDPRHADLVEIATAQKARDAAAAPAPTPAPAKPPAAPAPVVPDLAAAPAPAAAAKPGGPRRLTPDPEPDLAPAEPDPSTKPAGPAPKGRGGSTPPKVDPKHASTTVRPASKTEVVDDTPGRSDPEPPPPRQKSPISKEMRAALEDPTWPPMRRWIERTFYESESDDTPTATKGLGDLARIKARTDVYISGGNGANLVVIGQLMREFLRDLRMRLRERDSTEYLDRYFGVTEYKGHRPSASD